MSIDRDDALQRDVTVRGTVYTMAARRADNGDGWVSHLSRLSVRRDSQFPREPILDANSILHDQAALMRDTMGSGDTPVAALNDLESVLRELESR